jgi:DNA-directed RNA polymerase specialized sigma24 family protein
MATYDSRPGARGDEADLFRAFNDELMRTVSGSVFNSTPHTVEDACAFAWAQFLEHQPNRDENWRGWLFRTAQRQAWLLEGQARENLPLRSFEWEDLRETIQGIATDALEVQQDVHDALSIIGRLPPRLQRIALLRGLGLRHSDISDITGDSPTRVQQLVSRANQEIYEKLAERTHADEPSSPRAERLWELERDTPEWLSNRIGRLPRPSRRTSGQSLARRAWRRAAIALDDYYTATGPRRFEALLDTPVRDPELERLRRTAARAVELLEEARDRNPRRGVDE